jgi:hypothetical protein
MKDVYKTIPEAVEALTNKLLGDISCGLADYQYGECIAKDFAEVETDDEDYHEVEMSVRYDEWGGGPSPYDEPYGMYVIDVSLYVDGVYEEPSKYGITRDYFQM